MVKPRVRGPSIAVEAEAPDTARRILDAAFRCLHEQGYARLSTRDIAREAGVNHALIHYYFGTKDKLVLAALDEANRRLLDRQRAMYDAGDGFAEKWARARRFYQDDLHSGFVRVQMELWAASLSNDELRKEFLPRALEWRQIVTDAVAEAVTYYGLDLPVPARAIGSWIAAFWWGMEFEMLIGMDERVAQHEEALDAMQRVLDLLDEQVAHSQLPESAQSSRSSAKLASSTDNR